MKKRINNFFRVTMLVIFSLFISLISCEAILRIKHSIIPNYDIEMWKYAKSLKVRSKNEKIGHTHRKNRSEILQEVEIKTNNLGQRDVYIDNEMLKNYNRSFLILGSSITLGWGVENSETLTNQLNKISNNNNNKWIFINGGIGNYNTQRYVNNYLDNWSNLNITDLAIIFFVNDTEILKNKETSFLIEHSHFAVIIWKLLNSYKSKFQKENIDNYYKKLYEDDYDGYLLAKDNLIKLKKHCDFNNINCYIINMPDIHQLSPYKLGFINEKIELLAKENNFKYFDLLGIFDGIDEKKIWNNYNDPHPNGYAHGLMARVIYDFFIN